MAGLYPIAVLAVAGLAFAVAGLLDTSGFAAVYVAGLVLGNGRLPHRAATLAFAEGAALLAQIGLFVMLGLLASPDRLGDALVPALVVGLLLTLLARPLSVFVCALPFQIPRSEQLFLSWAGLRGAVPIVLATIPATEGYHSPQNVFDIVFVLVVVYTAVQAPTLPAVARRMGIVSPEVTTEVSIEVAPVDESDRELLDVTITAESKLVGLYVDALRLPGGASVTLVLRPDEHVVPDRHTRLRDGDRALIVTPARSRARGGADPRGVAVGPARALEPGRRAGDRAEAYPVRWTRSLSRV